jgi:hypothetical protein
MTTTPIADYEEPRAAFKALLRGNCDQRILIVRGESGCGKTTLLLHCGEQVQAPVVYVPIQLRGSAVSIAEIFSRAGNHLTWDRLPRFTEQLVALEGKPNVKVDNNWLLGVNNRISVVLHVEDQGRREQRIVALTEAWFSDVTNIRNLVVMLFDTYEHGSSEVQQWISGPFLARAARTDALRVVIAGQVTPEKTNIEWGQYSVCHDLFGVCEAKHWMPVVQEMKRCIDVPDPVSWLGGVCVALKGKPNEIIKVIEALPREAVM